MEKSTISMAIFNSYDSLPEGNKQDVMFVNYLDRKVTHLGFSRTLQYSSASFLGLAVHQIYPNLLKEEYYNITF